jgi:hypothetical protein
VLFHEHKSQIQTRGDWWSRKNALEIREELSTLYVECMATCTSITYVDGELVGDTMDVKMFEASGWVLDETSGGDD